MDNNRNSYKSENNNQKTSFQIGGSIILDNGLNISKIIKKAEMQLLSQKANKRHKTIDNSIYNNLSKKNYDIKSFPTSYQKFYKDSINNCNSLKYLNTENTNSGYPLTGVNIIGKSKYNISRSNLTKNKYYPKIFKETFSRNNNILNSEGSHHMKSGDIFNIPKAVRNIKKAVEMARKEKTKKKILLRSNLVFDENNLDVVFDSDNLINNYNTHVQTSICSDNNLDLFSFINKNKQISKNNVFINLLKREKSKIKKKLYIREKNFENNGKVLEEQENKFDEYRLVQNAASRKIDNSLLSLRIPTIKLLELRRDVMSDLKTAEDERTKLLEQIDDLRICAKFVCKVLGKNNTLFREKILHDDIENPDYETITKNVLKRFNCFLSDDNKNNSNNLREILNEPEIMIQKFKEIEDTIIRHLKMEEDIEDEIRDIQKEEEKNMLEIEKRYAELENDYQRLQNIYQNNLNEYNEILKRENNSSVDNEYNILIRDLFSEVMDIFKPKNSKFSGVNVKTIKIEDCVKETKRILTENETKLFNLMLFFDKAQKQNPKLFNEVITETKNDNKEKKLNMHKQNLEKKEKDKLTQTKYNSQKILFIPRKTVLPFQPQKKAKKIKVDQKVIEQKENEQLITYE